MMWSLSKLNRSVVSIPEKLYAQRQPYLPKLLYNFVFVSGTLEHSSTL